MNGFGCKEDEHDDEFDEMRAEAWKQVQGAVIMVAEMVDSLAGEEGKNFRKGIAKLAWNLYQEYKEVGFSEEQAMFLTSGVVKGLDKMNTGK